MLALVPYILNISQAVGSLLRLLFLGGREIVVDFLLLGFFQCIALQIAEILLIVELLANRIDALLLGVDFLRHGLDQVEHASVRRFFVVGHRADFTQRMHQFVERRVEFHDRLGAGRFCEGVGGRFILGQNVAQARAVVVPAGGDRVFLDRLPESARQFGVRRFPFVVVFRAGVAADDLIARCLGAGNSEALDLVLDALFLFLQFRQNRRIIFFLVFLTHDAARRREHVFADDLNAGGRRLQIVFGQAAVDEILHGPGIVSFDGAVGQGVGCIARRILEDHRHRFADRRRAGGLFHRFHATPRVGPIDSLEHDLAAIFQHLSGHVEGQSAGGADARQLTRRAGGLHGGDDHGDSRFRGAEALISGHAGQRQRHHGFRVHFGVGLEVGDFGQLDEIHAGFDRLLNHVFSAGGDLERGADLVQPEARADQLVDHLEDGFVALEFRQFFLNRGFLGEFLGVDTGLDGLAPLMSTPKADVAYSKSSANCPRASSTFLVLSSSSSD